MPLSHESSNMFALKSGVCEDAFYLVWEGKVLRDVDTLGRPWGLAGHATAHVLLSSWLVWVWADSIRFLDNGLAKLVALEGAPQRGKVAAGCGAASARWDWWSEASEGVSFSRATKQPGVCPSILLKGS